MLLRANLGYWLIAFGMIFAVATTVRVIFVVGAIIAVVLAVLFFWWDAAATAKEEEMAEIRARQEQARKRWAEISGANGMLERIKRHPLGLKPTDALKRQMRFTHLGRIKTGDLIYATDTGIPLTDLRDENGELHDATRFFFCIKSAGSGAVTLVALEKPEGRNPFTITELPATDPTNPLPFAVYALATEFPHYSPLPFLVVAQDTPFFEDLLSD